MNFDPRVYSYASRRNVVYAKNVMVATGQPMAAQAGLEILQKGGNAIDAAIATAVTLAVVEHTSNGIGGDSFALVWIKDKTADGEGNMVSYIQSNYMVFGSGLVLPGTGVALHNRGHNFVLDPNHDNALEPSKKPYHTIIPAFLTKDGKAVGPFGVMGGFMQPQGHLQVVMNTVDFHMNPQDALDAFRWQWVGGKKIEVEPGFPNYLALQLARLGHDIVPQLDTTLMGRGEIIWRD